MQLIEDILVCLRFWSRIPVPVLAREKEPHGMPDFARVCRMLPVAGAIIGLVGALVFIGARLLGLPGAVAAGLALTALVLATGAFHEDGLADTADGLGGGQTRQRKLEIMKDSRIGTFGGAALVLSLGLRWSALTAIDAAQGPIAAAAAIIAIAGLSRMAGLIPAIALEPARAEGAAQAAGAPSTSSFVIGMVLAIVIAHALTLETSGPLRAIAGIAAALAGAWIMTRIARRQIGGQTGDIAGASQQIAEIAFLLALASGQAI
ncbi:MAG: adenosylcobinamide-GDP ribazoletransferase [Beijerinckiaceae bacterium]|nr:adenosylcobinamide-GDP ribazoletransferase [Beijerinckiaceae bacterium]